VDWPTGIRRDGAWRMGESIVGLGDVTRCPFVGLEVQKEMNSIQIQADLHFKTRARGQDYLNPGGLEGE